MTQRRFAVYLFVAVARRLGIAVAGGSYLVLSFDSRSVEPPTAYLVVRGTYGV